MRCLSIRQPWAWLIVHGHKPVENRDWVCTFRGEFLVHAGKTFEQQALDAILDEFPELEPLLPETYDLGGIVGAARLVDCVTEFGSRWFTGPFGFVLADARPLTFRPFRGQLSFFDVPVTPDLQHELTRATPAEAERAGQERMF